MEYLKMKAPKLTSPLGRKHQLEDPEPLSEFLECIDDNVYVAIGAASGLIYIGKVKDFIVDLPFIDLHYAFLAARDTIPKTVRDSDGVPHIKQNPYSPHVTLLDHQVKEYWSRKIDDEPPMWIISIEGEETGECWLLKEYFDVIERYRMEFQNMNFARKRPNQCKAKISREKHVC